jgi:hypothetical protein
MRSRALRRSNPNRRSASSGDVPEGILHGAKPGSCSPHETSSKRNIRSHIGQTKRSLKLRYQEHIQYIKNNNPQSAYAMHILNNRHEYGPMHNTMEFLKQTNKTKFLIPYEQLYIHSHHITNNWYLSIIAVNTNRRTDRFTTNRSCHTLPSHRTYTHTLKPNKPVGPQLATSQQLQLHATHTKNC